MKNKFFDREEYLKILEKRVNNLILGYRQNLAILGDENIGKTSLIIKFLNNFYDNRVVFIYLENRPESLESFVKRFIGVLLYNFLINSGEPLKEELDFLIKKASGYIPQTVSRIRQILNNLKKKIEPFKETLMLTEVFFQETSKRCVIIFDEFHNLENIRNKNIYQEWAKVLAEQKNTLYIITSSMKLKARVILNKYLSLLFGNFEIITLEPFDIEKSENYLEERLASLNINPGFKNFLIHFTGGHPFYLEIICEAIIKDAQKNLVDILEELLFSSSGILNQRFTDYLRRISELSYSNDCLSILYLVSAGCNKIKDIANNLHKTQKEIKQRINYLSEYEIITRNGDFLKINDRIFGFWLRFVYQEKLTSLTFDAKNQKETFRRKIEEMLQEFLIEAQKPIIKRLIELLHSFEGETIQMDRKKIRCSRFREIKQLEFDSHNLREGIIGRAQDEVWIIGFKYGQLSENDIIDFTRECKRYRNYRNERKIIITLEADIDQNTRLRAMEEKVYIWDLNNLNQIMDLFYRTRIIL